MFYRCRPLTQYGKQYTVKRTAHLHHPITRPTSTSLALCSAPMTRQLCLSSTSTTTSTSTPSSPPTPETPETPEVPKAKAKLDRRVYSIAVSSLLMGSGIGIVIPVMPLFASSIGISQAGLGMIVASMGAARLCTNVPAGWAAERFGRKPLMVLGPMVSAFGTVLCSVATSLPQLLAFRAMSGFGGSVQMTGSQLYLADISVPETRAQTMAPLAIAFSIGMGLGPVAGGYLAAGSGLAAPFVYVGAAMFLAGINNAVSLTETKPPKPNQKLKPLKEEILSVVRQWKPIAKNESMRAALMLHSVYWGITSGAMFTLLPLFAAETFDVTAVELGQGFSALAAINLVGSQPLAWASDRYGRKAVIAPAVMLMAFSTLAMPLAQSREALGALWIIWSVGVTCLGTSPTAYTTDLHTDKNRAQALALLRSAGDVGLMTGAGCIGLIAKVFGVTAGFWSAGGLFALVGINFCLKAVETVGKNKGSL